MKKLTADTALALLGRMKKNATYGEPTIHEGYTIQALEIALPILEQQERLSVEPVAFTGSGSLAAIKAGAEGVIWGRKADAHPIELFARYPASFCQKCNNTGSMDSGGSQPWGEAIMVECDCQFEKQEKGERKPNHAQCCAEAGGDISICDCVNKDWVYLPQLQPSTNPQIDNDGWIEWRGGECPVDIGTLVEFEMRDGDKDTALSTVLDWPHENRSDDIIAYRVVPGQPTNQNGEQ